jgi:intracellular septation protein A
MQPGHLARDAAAPAFSTESRPGGLVLPSLWQIARRVAPQVVEGALIPLGLFLIAMRTVGIGAAMAVGLSWSALAVVRRAVRSRRIPTMILVGGAMLGVKAVLLLATGSAFLYFLQPMLGAAVLAAAFVFSVVRGQPLARRFAADLGLLPGHVFHDPILHGFFQRISLMWAAVVLANAAFGFWLLSTQSTAVFLATRTVGSVAIIATAAIASTRWFGRSAAQVLAPVVTA